MKHRTPEQLHEEPMTAAMHAALEAYGHLKAPHDLASRARERFVLAHRKMQRRRRWLLGLSVATTICLIPVLATFVAFPELHSIIVTLAQAVAPTCRMLRALGTVAVHMPAIPIAFTAAMAVCAAASATLLVRLFNPGLRAQQIR